MEEYLTNFKHCRQKEIPPCASACPFHLDVVDFIEKMKRGSFKAAFKVYRNAVGFPAVVSRLCTQPCQAVCPGAESGGAIELRQIEQACVNLTENKSPTEYNLPLKKKKVAIIGAGVAGLACALRLCMKKYEVDVFEKSDRIGGALWERMEPEIFLSDIKEQFQHETYTLHLSEEIQSADDLKDGEYDAVYVATGKEGADFDLLVQTGNAGDVEDTDNRYCAYQGETGWFAGGGLIGEEGIHAIANGLYAGTIIDNFLKTGNLLYPDNLKPTRCTIDQTKANFGQAIVPQNPAGYNAQEAQQEALRCLECQCDFCRSYCDLTDYFNKWPLRIRDEIIATTMPGSADIKATPAKRLLSTCNQCGMCKEVCPEEIDLGGLILAGRKSMHQQKKVPWVFHDFWLQDMDFANSQMAALNKRMEVSCPVYADESLISETDSIKAEESPGYAFFPGCQLGASDPLLVEKTYAYLLHQNPEVGLMLRCCGVPAEWAGDEEKHTEEIRTIREQWEELGKPKLILACPTCLKKFKQYMEDIPVVSLYEIMDEWGSESLWEGQGTWAITSQTYSVFDACAARHEEGMKQAVQKLAKQTGCELEPLPEEGAGARCCGYGGQPGLANPDYVKFVAEKRISQGEAPYITYCINCRDIFIEAGKEAVHILELFFEEKPKPLATVSERRENRVQLKRQLLKKFWGEEMEDQKNKSGITLVISPALSQKMNQKRMLEEDIAEVIAFCERTGRRAWLPDQNAYSGYHEKGYMTYWVEYKAGAEEGTYELVNAYSHRMKIELEEVWNGRKTSADL